MNFKKCQISSRRKPGLKHYCIQTILKVILFQNSTVNETIERVWGQSKKFTRAHCDYSLKGLENTLDESLDTIPLNTIRRFFREMRDYLAAYREGLTLGPQMEAAVKQYKSHRKVRE